MQRNFVVVSALMSAMFMVGFVHAPAMPVIAGAAIACAWTLWRSGGGS